MYFYPFEVTAPHITYALLGGFIVLFGMFSLLLRERLYIGEAIWAFIFGVIIGPYGANIFNPRAWGSGSDPEEVVDVITLEFTRVVLAIGVFAIGVELPKAYMAKHWKSLFFLLVPGMTWGWFVCAGLIYGLIPGLNFLSSLAISACLTPTDPILASAVVGGKWADKHVPAHIRHLLAAESGCNDGAAFPFLFFALYLMTDLPSVGNAMRDWFLLLWLYQIILGILIGSFLGFSFRHLMKFCQRHDFIDRQSYVAQYLSLAILTIGLTTLIGSDDLLAAFACGTSFAWDGFFNKQTEESVFSSVIDTLFNVAAFIFLGAWMPFGSFHAHIEHGIDAMGGIHVWRLIVLAILVLLLRRLPIMMGMYRCMPDVKTWREAVFTGHFGPMGVGAIFISTFATIFIDNHISKNASTSADQEHQLELVRDMIQPIVAFMVLCSITIHGLSIPGFSLGRRVHSVSRTWSRRDTVGSGRTGAPDWTNQARLVTRAEDIVINRDLERGDGVPLEKPMTGDGLKPDAITQEIKFEGNPTPAPPATQRDSRNEFPPDGEHRQTSEWIEGDQKVVERNMDDDVQVTVIDESPKTEGNASAATSWAGKTLHQLERGAQEIGHSMRDGVLRSFHLGARGGDQEMELELETGHRTTRPDTLVADELPDVHHSEEPSSAQTPISPDTGHTTAHPRKSRNKRRSSSLTRLPSQNRHQETVNLDLDTGSAANQNGKVVEGRFGLLPVFIRRTMSNPRLGMVGRIATTPGSSTSPPGSSTSILVPSPAVPLSYSPHLLPRPGTGDSTVSIRHHRLDSIRARPTTRESSPSRSVRFVDVPPPAPAPPQTPILSRSSSFNRERDGVNGRTAVVDSRVEDSEVGGPASLNAGSLDLDSRWVSRPPTR